MSPSIISRVTGDTIRFDPVVPSCAPGCFEAVWSVMVAFPGKTWGMSDEPGERPGRSLLPWCCVTPARTRTTRSPRAREALYDGTKPPQMYR